MMDIAVAVRELRAAYHRRLGERDAILRKIEQTEEKLTQLQKEMEILLQVKILLQQSSHFAREQARKQIEGMVSQALQYIFGDENMEFRVEIEEVRGRAEGEFYVVSLYGGEIPVQTRPQDARGGGVVDVISLALRAALLQATRMEGPIILDEPGKHVSAEYSRNVAQFLKELSAAFGRQIILVTHNAELASMGDVSYLVELREGRSHVTPFHATMLA
jgi:DNA repair ATPase RecN